MRSKGRLTRTKRPLASPVVTIGALRLKLASGSGIHQCGITATICPSTLSEPASKSYCRSIVKLCNETAKPARKSSLAIQSKACAAPAEP